MFRIIILLVGKREQREKKNPPSRFSYIDLIASALIVATEVIDEALISYKVIISLKHKERHIEAMQEEIKFGIKKSKLVAHWST